MAFAFMNTVAETDFQHSEGYDSTYSLTQKKFHVQLLFSAQGLFVNLSECLCVKISPQIKKHGLKSGDIGGHASRLPYNSR
jgi:hypothetical protein